MCSGVTTTDLRTVLALQLKAMFECCHLIQCAIPLMYLLERLTQVSSFCYLGGSYIFLMSSI